MDRMRTTLSQLDKKKCPGVFLLLPADGAKAWYDVKAVVQTRFKLHLMCEAPQGYHCTDHHGYELHMPKEQLRKYAPYISLMSKVWMCYACHDVMAAFDV